MTQQKTRPTMCTGVYPRTYYFDPHQVSPPYAAPMSTKECKSWQRRSLQGQYGRALTDAARQLSQTEAVRRIMVLIEQWYGPVIMELVSAWAHGQGFAEQVRRIYSEPGMEAEQHLLYSYRPKLYEADQAPASQMAATRNAVLRFLRSLRDRLTDDPQVFELLTQAGWRV